MDLKVSTCGGTPEAGFAAGPGIREGCLFKEERVTVNGVGRSNIQSHGGDGVPLRSIAWFCIVMAFGPPLSALQKGSEHDELPPFQKSLMLVISGSHERFRPVMGQLINEQFRDFRFYEVKYKLDGAHICRIFEYRAVVYVCDWDERTTPRELSLQVESALGPDWQPKEAGAYREILRFRHRKEPDNNPIIEVIELQNGVRVTMFPPDRVEPVGGASWHSPE